MNTYATRTRNTRPETFAVHLNLGEHINLTHMD